MQKKLYSIVRKSAVSKNKKRELDMVFTIIINSLIVLLSSKLIFDEREKYYYLGMMISILHAFYCLYVVQHSHGAINSVATLFMALEVITLCMPVLSIYILDKYNFLKDYICNLCYGWIYRSYVIKKRT